MVFTVPGIPAQLPPWCLHVQLFELPSSYVRFLFEERVLSLDTTELGLSRDLPGLRALRSNGSVGGGGMNKQGSHLLCPAHQVYPPHHPSSQLMPEPASEALVKDREALCICSIGHACNFHESLPNSRGHRTYLRVLILLKQCSILKSGLRLVARVFLLYLLCSLKPRPFPRVGTSCGLCLHKAYSDCFVSSFCLQHS